MNIPLSNSLLVVTSLLLCLQSDTVSAMDTQVLKLNDGTKPGTDPGCM